ncbi:MAG TPA: SprT family zinc-dependent metalloprotease [Candidatus Eremiobacteraeota bacterium]|nr:MAG: WLM domain protein [bacterium ADurb.Bin363]HPZ08125.1 SprT family zinc-dependent metalloprotease [Candidatus Eremiobacteraeota bacterium]
MTEKTYHIITYGSQTIKFKLELNHRKSLKITVTPDLHVTVKAPSAQPIDIILEKVKKKAHWIIKQQTFFNSLPPPPPERRYLSGETHMYLGKQYRLKIIESAEEEVKLKGGYIYINTREKDNLEKIKTLLEKWYSEHARVKFNQRINLCYEKVKKYDIKAPLKISIKKMKKRWGSCSKKGNILLNRELIKAPSHCIDYVIIHELCHLKHYNHNNNFFKLLSQVMPDWQKRKERLEQIVL